MAGRLTAIRNSKRTRFLLAIISATAILLALSLSSNPAWDRQVAAEPTSSPSPGGSGKDAAPVNKEAAVPAQPAEVPDPGVTAEDESTARAEKKDKKVPLDPKKVRKAARASVESYMGLFDSALQGDVIDSAALAAVSIGSASTELEAAAADYSEQEFRQTGNVRVVGVEFPKMSLKSKKPSVTADVCVDLAAIDVLDGTGSSLSAFLFRPGEPVIQRFVISLHKSAWRVEAREIPDEVIPCTN